MFNGVSGKSACFWRQAKPCCWGAYSQPPTYVGGNRCRHERAGNLQEARFSGEVRGPREISRIAAPSYFDAAASSW